MKKTIQSPCLKATLFCLFYAAAMQAQDVDKELAVFTQQYQDAYNKEDSDLLQSFYTADAAHLVKDVGNITGATQISAFWAEQFKSEDVILSLSQTLVSWSDANHAYMAKGAYRAVGTNTKGEKINRYGIYTNLMQKQAGAWKIAKTWVEENRRQPIREVSLSGTGYELGLQHGQIFIKEIGELVAKFKEKTTRELGKDANEVLADFYKKTNFNDAIKHWTPELYEEVRGIADGARQLFDDVMVFSLLDEFWVYQNNLNNHHCSGVGVPARDGQPSYIAQNMDIEAYTDGYQVLLRIARNGERPEQLILTHPGLIALSGMNESGVGACMNTLMQLKASTTGLPVAFIVRRILRSTDKDDLLHFIQNVPHASGQNYIIGIRGEVYDFEASANKVVRFDPKNENGTVYHTNHPLVNDDLKEWFKKYDPNLKAEDKPVNSNSFVRLAAVQRRMVPTGVITDVAIMEALRSKDDEKYPVCVTPNQWGMTFGSVIMTLSGQPFMQVTAGPPDESEYLRVDFSEK